MPIRLNLWTAPNGFERIYINGLNTTDKVWLQKGAREQIKITSGGLTSAVVERALLDAYGLQRLDWDELIEIARTPVPKGKPPTGTPIVATVPFGINAGHWTSEDAEALDADTMAHPIPEPTTLLVDHREPAELKDRLRAIHNLIVQEEQLEVGDYVIPDLLTIERKTISDLVVSITEDARRLFHQTDAMTMVPGSSVLLLEGDVYGQQRLTLPNIAGTLSYLAVIQGVSVLPTLSLPHSVYMIAKLVRHRVYGLGYDIPLRGTAPKHAAKAAAFVLEGFPGISANLARRLLKHFGSVQAVANATEAQLRAVDGIGPSKAKAIAEVLTAPYAE
ncbi:ERCC4 domain-containing protein [Microvirga sp. Mcv34]|uniref:ERCC4 domain-containing protein n=1 Tax=Microvirga sp. Mcv34 TaxID=2926016 RepID=UPI0021C82BF5|nr:ERCC4 domain-containing protein [Microvirga sp. Mcv34]